MEQEIKSLLYELGIPVIQREKIVAPNCVSIHYDLVKIEHLAQVEKKVKFLSAYLHKDIVYQKSEIAHFSLRLPREDDKFVKFYDEEYDYIFNKKLTKDRDIFMGVDNNNVPRVFNLDDMPHILIAGTTGSGKSVMLNNIICCLLRNAKKECRPSFTMIDTKRVELSMYRNLPDCDIATTAEQAVELLEGVCYRLESRYAMMESQGIRKISSDYFRHIVVIEELGDLMMATNGAVEKYIVKIAQLGRACGVHLIVATQHPVVRVITGAIKANISCRIALQVTSGIDSRNILGHNGAEKLKGKGDCLLKLPDKANEIHLQCPLVTDSDITRAINAFIGG